MASSRPCSPSEYRTRAMRATPFFLFLFFHPTPVPSNTAKQAYALHPFLFACALTPHRARSPTSRHLDQNDVHRDTRDSPGKLVPVADTFSGFLDNATEVFGVKCVDAYRKSGRPLEDINVLAAAKVVFLTFEEDAADLEAGGQGEQASASSAPQNGITPPPHTTVTGTSFEHYSANSPFFDEGSIQSAASDIHSDGSGSIALNQQFANVPMVSFVHDAMPTFSTPTSEGYPVGKQSAAAAHGDGLRRKPGALKKTPATSIADVHLLAPNSRGGASVAGGALGMLTPLKTQEGTRREEQVVALRRCRQAPSPRGGRKSKLVTTDEPSMLVEVKGDFNDFVKRALELFPGEEMRRLCHVSRSIDPVTNKRKWVKMETIQDIISAGNMANMVLVTAAEPAEPASSLRLPAAAPAPEKTQATARTHFKRLGDNVYKEVQEKNDQSVFGFLKAGSKWQKLIYDVIDNKRPYFEYTWATSLTADLTQMCGMCLLPIFAAFILVCVPLPQPEDCGSGKLASSWGFALGAVPIFSASVSTFGIQWLGFYFFIKFSLIVRLVAVVGGFLFGLVFYIAVASAIGYPLPQTTLFMMVAVTTATYAAAVTRMPLKLRRKSTFTTHLSNSFVILGALIAVFLINRLLVVNLVQKDVRSLLALSAIYPLLVFRGTMDCTRIAEKYNKRSAPVVEGFFVYVSSVFQAILFLSIGAEINGWVVFCIINSMDIGCLLASGPLMALLNTQNKKLMKLEDANSEYALNQWSQDPLKLKPLLVKTYCEMSAKFMVLLIFTFIRSDATGNRRAFSFIDKPKNEAFNDMITFTIIELIIWSAMHYTVEVHLRFKRAQHAMADAKKAMLGNLAMLSLTNVMITLMLFLWETCANKS